MAKPRKSTPLGATSGSSTGARGVRFKAGTEDFVVISYPVTSVDAPSVLTAAEAAVFRMLLADLSNQQIGEARRSSARTVANQVASIFKKLRVQSRAELRVAFGGGTEPKP